MNFLNPLLFDSLCEINLATLSSISCYMTFPSLVCELHYLPCIELFQHFKTAEVVYLEAHENYQKRSYRNRAYLTGANGMQRLSIPLEKGKNQQLSIREVSLAYHESWPKQHWQSIVSAYGNAPYFPYYADELADLYTKRYSKLWDFNYDLLKLIWKMLQWEDNLALTSEYLRSYPAEVLDLRNSTLPTSLADAKSDEFPVYPQVFRERHGFQPNLSILDLLFCQGPQANLYLSR